MGDDAKAAGPAEGGGGGGDSVSDLAPVLDGFRVRWNIPRRYQLEGATRQNMSMSRSNTNLRQDGAVDAGNTPVRHVAVHGRVRDVLSLPHRRCGPPLPVQDHHSSLASTGPTCVGVLRAGYPGQGCWREKLCEDAAWRAFDVFRECAEMEGDTSGGDSSKDAPEW